MVASYGGDCSTHWDFVRTSTYVYRNEIPSLKSDEASSSKHNDSLRTFFCSTKRGCSEFEILHSRKHPGPMTLPKLKIFQIVVSELSDIMCQY